MKSRWAAFQKAPGTEWGETNGNSQKKRVRLIFLSCPIMFVLQAVRKTSVTTSLQTAEGACLRRKRERPILAKGTHFKDGKVKKNKKKIKRLISLPFLTISFCLLITFPGQQNGCYQPHLLLSTLNSLIMETFIELTKSQFMNSTPKAVLRSTVSRF